MEDKSTPGPWSLCGDKCKCGVISGEHYPVAEVFSGEWGDRYPSIRLVGSSLDLKAEPYNAMIVYGTIAEETAQANARLIAAAPELLAALEELWANRKDARMHTYVISMDYEQSDRIRNILVKAKGD